MRPLKRAIQEHLLDPLETKLLAGEFKPGEKIEATAKDDALLLFRRSESVVARAFNKV